MTEPVCRKWAEDPDGTTREHLASCETCRRDAAAHEQVERGLAAVAAEPAPIPVRDLPVAPWEGAQHRAWGFVLLALLGVAILAGVLFYFLGVSPLAALTALAGTAAASRTALSLLTDSLGELLTAAPRRFDIGVAIGFVAVNAILFFMLRRGPRGYDVRSR